MVQWSRPDSVESIDQRHDETSCANRCIAFGVLGLAFGCMDFGVSVLGSRLYVERFLPALWSLSEVPPPSEQSDPVFDWLADAAAAQLREM